MPSIKILPPGHGESLWALGEKLTFKLGSQDTGGAFELSELLAQPDNGPPPHLHRCEAEMFYVLEGEFAFTLGQRTFTRSTGFAAYLPRGVLHTYNNVGQRSGRMLVAAVPGGFERFIRAWARPVSDPAEPPPRPTQQEVETLMATAPHYGVELYPEAKAIPDRGAPPAERAYWVLGQLVTIKLVGQETAGHFSVVEVTALPGTGVPSHLHVAMEEIFYVLDGTFDFTVGSRLERLGPGSLTFVPRGTPHGFRNVGDRAGRLLDVHSPAGFEAFFEEAGLPAADPNAPPQPAEAPDLESLIRLFRKHGMELQLR